MPAGRAFPGRVGSLTFGSDPGFLRTRSRTRDKDEPREKAASSAACGSHVGLAIALVALTRLGPGAGLPLPILRKRAAHIVRFLERAVRRAPHVPLVRAGV